MKRWTAVLAWSCLPGLLSGCAALREAGEKGTAAGAATGVGFLAWLLHPVGAVGGLLAAAGAALAALVLGGGDRTVNEAPSTAWDAVVPLAALVLLVLFLRAWAHWLPPLLEVLKRTAKGTPRALLGGRARDPQAPRFRRRAD